MAQAELGEMYYSGHGVDRNLQQAAYWLEQSAAADYPRAKLDLLQLNAEVNPGSTNPADALGSMFRSISGAGWKQQ